MRADASTPNSPNLITTLARTCVFVRRSCGGFMSFTESIRICLGNYANFDGRARRLHDTGKSGWLQLLWLIPCIGFIILIVLLVQPGNPGENSYGPPVA
jgi:hypothetical protein